MVAQATRAKRASVKSAVARKESCKPDAKRTLQIVSQRDGDKSDNFVKMDTAGSKAKFQFGCNSRMVIFSETNASLAHLINHGQYIVLCWMIATASTLLFGGYLNNPIYRLGIIVFEKTNVFQASVS